MDTLDLECHNKRHGYDRIDQVDCYVESERWSDCDSHPCPNRLFSIVTPQYLDDEESPRFLPTTLEQILGLTPESIALPDTRAPTPALITRPPSPIPAPTSEEAPTPTMSAEVIQALVTGQTQMQQAIAALTTAVTTLTTTVNNGNQIRNDNAERQLDKAIQKPTPFKGTSSADARRFLAAFAAYAFSTGPLLNERGDDGRFHRHDQKWIFSALSFLQDDAAIWATPYMERISGATPEERPFNDNYELFRAAFRSRFETSDEAVDAKDALRLLHQENKTVPEYAAKFKELMSRTGYSEADLRDRFYEHLASRIKDELVHTARPIGTLDELIAVATDLDVRIRQRKAEKAREQGKFAPTPKYTTTTPATPFVTKDPNAMDIDASHTRESFLKSMTGKCFGCGSTAHSKRDGNHERDLCAWCGRTGHRETVCRAKYMGQPKKQRVAATEEAPSDSAAPASEATVSASQVDIIAQLLEGQRQLAAQIEAMKQAF